MVGWLQARRELGFMESEVVIPAGLSVRPTMIDGGQKDEEGKKMVV